MSWAEIKKAVNSNLDIPLNDYVACGSPVFLGVYNSGATGLTGTLVEVSGKGRLNYVFFGSANLTQNETTPKLKVTVDGEPIAYWQFVQNVSGSYEPTLSIFTSTTSYLDSYYTSVRFPTESDVIGIQYTGSRRVTISPSLQLLYTTPQDTTSTFRNYHMITINPIIFKESLKVELEGTSKPFSRWACNYELLD